jgi:Caspase domain
MNPAYDRRTEIGLAPGVHALVVGVGQYQNDSIPRLASSVSSAHAVAEWLENNDLAVPLATCRVLVSDGENCTASVNHFLQAASDWRKDACSNRDNIALFYFCGMGFQRSPTEDLVLFEDFGGVGPALRGAVSVDNLFQGMAPGLEAQEIARTQLYFIDTNRAYERSSERYQLSNPTMIFDEYRAGPDDRSAVVFYATQPGSPAYAMAGEKISLFTTALLRCLNGEAATAIDPSPPVRWGVTINSLIQGLNRLTKSLSDTWGIGHLPTQAPVVGGLVRDHIIRFLNEIPIAAVKVRLEQATPFSDLWVENSDGHVVYKASVDSKDGVQLELPSGFYVIHASATDGSRRASTIASLRPGSSDLRLVMSK